MADTDRLAKELAGIIRGSGSRQTKAYDTPATVRRIDGSTAWVHIPGGVDETPVQLTIAASVGDTVQVRVSGGRAWMVGNASAPPTDDRVAVAAREKADEAAQVAEAAETLGTEAREVARAAAKIAGDTEQHFWFTETGTDTGAHITEKTQEDFLADPDSGGGNLLARSNGIAVRDGMVELAQFAAEGIELSNSQMNVFRAKTSGTTSTTRVWDTIFNGAFSTGEVFSVTRVYGTLSGSIGFSLYNFSAFSSDSASFTAGTSGSDTLTVTGASASITYDGASTFNITISASGNIQQLRAELDRVEIIDAPYFTLGTRAGDTGGFSTTIGESLYAEKLGEVAIGRYNKQDVGGYRLFSIGDGINDTYRKDIFSVNTSGVINAGLPAGLNSLLSTLGWSDAKADGLLIIQTLLEKILDRIALYDKPLVTNANWSSGTLSVPGSSKYRVFEVVQGGAATICTRYGNDLRGFSLSGNSTANNWNQYVRAFGATADWSTEVWTLEWAKQLSHVTSSGYHTSGTTQAVTEIRGLIPLQNA